MILTDNCTCSDNNTHIIGGPDSFTYHSPTCNYVLRGQARIAQRAFLNDKERTRREAQKLSFEQELANIGRAFRTTSGLVVLPPVQATKLETFDATIKDFDIMDKAYEYGYDPFEDNDEAPLYNESELVPNPSVRPLIYKRPTMFRFWSRYILRKLL